MLHQKWPVWMYISEALSSPPSNRILKSENARQAMYKERNIEVLSSNHRFSQKSSKYCIFWVCVCSLGFVQHTIRMRCAILLSVAYPCLQYFSTLSHKWHDYRKKGYLNIEWVFSRSLQLLSEIFLIIRRNEGNMVLMNIGLLVKYPLFFPYIKKT